MTTTTTTHNNDKLTRTEDDGCMIWSSAVLKVLARKDQLLLGRRRNAFPCLGTEHGGGGATTMTMTIMTITIEQQWRKMDVDVIICSPQAPRCKCLFSFVSAVTKKAASSTPPMRWAARCVVHVYSADSPVALSRPDDGVMIMILDFWILVFGIFYFGTSITLKAFAYVLTNWIAWYFCILAWFWSCKKNANFQNGQHSPFFFGLKNKPF